MGEVTPANLNEYFTSRLNSCREYSKLKFEYVNIRRVWNFSYYIGNDYPKIKLLMSEISQNIKRADVNRELIQRSILHLKNDWDFENWLMLSLISKYSLFPSILVLIRFEDFWTREDNSLFLNVYSKQRMKHEAILIDEETFSMVRELKNARLNHKKQQYETKRGWGKGYHIRGYFIFQAQRCSIGRRLQNGFNGKIPEFSSSPLKIMAACKESK